MVRYDDCKVATQPVRWLAVSTIDSACEAYSTTIGSIHVNTCELHKGY